MDDCPGEVREAVDGDDWLLPPHAVSAAAVSRIDEITRTFCLMVASSVSRVVGDVDFFMTAAHYSLLRLLHNYRSTAAQVSLRAHPRDDRAFATTSSRRCGCRPAIVRTHTCRRRRQRRGASRLRCRGTAPMS